jgi:hypothetical protein
MLKIGQKITSYISKHEGKRTASAKYDKYMTRAKLSAFATGVQVFRLPSWVPEIDIPITSFTGAFCIKSFEDAISLLKDLRVIKKRALSIKKATRLN